MPQAQPQPEESRPDPQPIPALRRAPAPAAQAPALGKTAVRWVQVAAVGLFLAGLATVMADKAVRQSLLSNLGLAPRSVVVASPALPPVPAFTPPPMPAAQAAAVPAAGRPVEALPLFSAREEGGVAAADELVPYGNASELGAPAVRVAPAALAPAQAVVVRAALPVKSQGPIRFRNSIFEKAVPTRQRAVTAVPNYPARMIPAPCDWKLAAPGSPCWESGGLMIKNQGVQQGAIKVGPQQGPSGIWYQPGTSGQTPSPPAGPAAKK
ncbi:MAG: hypothetical protein NTY77_11340 [Elusimicrobia bacterium]|nr:hypothetical protein [Elusimicrobiota bacterium]